MKKAITSRQQEILDFIRFFSARKMMPPTLSEISEHFNIRCSSVAYHLKALEQKGHLSRTNESRSIVLENQIVPCLRKDCQRRIDLSAPGKGEDDPAAQEENSKEVKKAKEPDNNSFYLSDHLLEICPAEEFILLRQPDDSMFEMGIHQNDLLLAVPVRFKKPQQGDFVLANLPGGRTVIRSYFFHSAKQFELVPANSEFEAEAYPYADGIVQAVVVSLQRAF